MKTLDVQALHKAIDQTLEQLKHQSDEFNKVKKAIESITSLDDALKGKGGDAIRAFYEECHTPFLQFYDTFIEEYSSTLKKMKSALNSLEPNHNGFISQSFLEHELEQGLNAADRTTKRLVSKTNATIAKVSHIVDLPDLNDSGFHEQNQKALKEINQTIEKLHAFDREQTSALKTAESDLETMQRYISRLEKMYTGPKIEITGYQKGSILKPDEMDALRGGQDTAMGVMLDKLDKRSKLEKEASKIEPMSHTDTLKKKLEKLYDDPDEFLKIAREIGYDNLTSDQLDYVTAIEEAYEFRADPIKGTLEDGKNILESIKGSAVALYDYAIDTAVGVKDLSYRVTEYAFKTDKEKKNAIIFAAINTPIYTEMIKKSMQESWDKNVVHGDAYTRAHYITYVAANLLGFKGVSSVTSAGGKVAGKVGKATETLTEKGAEASKKAAAELKKKSNAFAPQLASDIGAFPYNTINDVTFKERLLKFARSLNPKTRLPRTGGIWDGTPGNGKWYSDKPEVITVTKGKPIVFKDGRPDFTPWKVGKDIKFESGELKGTKADFDKVYERIMEDKNLKSLNQAKIWLRKEKLTPHHLDGTTIQLIPTDLHKNVPHIGSASDLRGGY
ncbi:T7SS effector LXG polymorphic toxin [Bacillus haynesii]|uniref:T7SS effector LXG polymorphic toxin n=1 Tax=Bacillus haynesii TaxID=1925021 RepID=UPI00227F23B0|nr:T7SS effector LXG polymorphic toxin [Bacillus haynesii]MCY8378430.1 T7SS effector LXG polymorphic toxin [Bacillus haynesii]MCY8611547.1 T7SS effector LXG polymorphic toxin [Bacillus haynesii]MEC0676685.1 T7SS effector LXG polymorphic toxin [Bacillus haynesii]